MNINAVEILLVEDNMDDAELTIRALKKNKFKNQILHVQNGEEALDFIFASGQYAKRKINSTLKFILLDLHMPKVGGIDVLKKLKADENTKKYPVVVLSSSQENNDINTCYELGANSFIVKPLDFDNFVSMVGQLGKYWLNTNQLPE